MQVVFDPITAPQESLVQVSTGRPVTRAEYFAFYKANPDLRIGRSAEGELIVMAPVCSRTGGQNAELTFQLTAWARQDGTGMAFDSSARFDLPNGSNRPPDASWVLKNRIGAQVGWLIDPIEHCVWIYRPWCDVERLDNPPSVSAGPLMPGFVRDFTPIWNPPV